MGYEVIFYGCIEGVKHPNLEKINVEVIASLPVDDEWLFLVRGMFSLPEPSWGTYQTSVIHFGGSQKDSPFDCTWEEEWVLKFENLLRQMFWCSARVHIHRDFEPECWYEWVPSLGVVKSWKIQPRQPVQTWTRTTGKLIEDSD